MGYEVLLQPLCEGWLCQSRSARALAGSHGQLYGLQNVPGTLVLAALTLGAQASWQLLVLTNAERETPVNVGASEIILYWISFLILWLCPKSQVPETAFFFSSEFGFRAI